MTVDDERFPTRGTAKAVIGEYIEQFYTLQRRHSHVDYTSPVEFQFKAPLAALGVESDRPRKRGRITAAPPGRQRQLWAPQKPQPGGMSMSSFS